MGPEAKLERKLKRAVEAVGGMFIKQTGMAGIPDRLVIVPLSALYPPQPHYIFVELKSADGRLSTVQKAMIDRMRRMGIDVEVLRGEAEVDAFIEYLRRCVPLIYIRKMGGDADETP